MLTEAEASSLLNALKFTTSDIVNLLFPPK